MGEGYCGGRFGPGVEATVVFGSVVGSGKLDRSIQSVGEIERRDVVYEGGHLMVWLVVVSGVANLVRYCGDGDMR